MHMAVVVVHPSPFGDIIWALGCELNMIKFLDVCLVELSSKRENHGVDCFAVEINSIGKGRVSGLDCSEDCLVAHP